ncbi:MAG: gliding motility-associated C-terminal domain-containing protein, partial [Tenuifilaceae bacterium]|nr:gliding motility-associated C-terminal domain-containing protein [Tenuifilaceae bacterium]
NNASAGTYTLTSVSDLSCNGTVSGTATVTELITPTATISGGGNYCAGTMPTGVDVSVALTGNGPWDIVYAIDGANQVVITAIISSPYVISNAIEGEYTLISVDDSNGCVGTVSGTATVIELELPTATMSGGGAYCIGANPTGVDVQIDFIGVAPWTYSFAVNGDVRTFISTVNQRIFEDAGEGHFTLLSVHDANCTGTVSGEAFVVEIETAAPTGDANQEFCAGATIADINVTGEGIAWYDAPNGNMLNMTDILVDGVTYYATQTAQGCESLGYLAVTVSVWNELTISIIEIKHGRCDIPNAGSIEVQGVGSVFNYTYTLFDEFNNQIGLPIVSSNADPVLFTGLAPGKYYVNFDDLSPCAAKTTALVEILEAVPVTIDDVLITNSNCFGNNNAKIEVTASGGGANLYFSLLDNLETVVIGPQTNDGVIVGVADGDYIILVESDNGCEARLAIEVKGPDELSVQAEIINIPCSNSGDIGIIRALAVGGTAPYSVSLYLNGVLEDQVTGVGYNTWVEFDQLPVGSNYEVVVDDRWGCGPVSSGALEITLPSALVVGAPIVQDVLCNGDATGQVTITASGGTAPYTFTLLDNSNNAIATSTNGVFENVAFGNNYSISVVDDNACNQVLSSLFDINEPDPIVIDINSILVNSISCYGAANGEVSISASGGTGDLYYMLTNAGLTIGGPQLGNGAFTGLSSGGYIIEVTDDRNCGPVLSDVIDIDEPEQLIVQVIVNNPLCNDNIGSINVLASKGTSPYTYELYTGVTLTETITGVTDEEVVFNNLASATYFVKITDANGCTLFTDNESIEVAPEKLLLTLNSTDPILNNDGTTVNGTIEATAFGGTVPYQYFLFKLGETVSLDDNVSGIFSIIEGGAYQVKVIDANGCEVIGDIALSQYTFTLSATDVLCFGSCDGTITVNQVYGSSTLDQRKWLNSNEEDISAEMKGKYDVAEGLYKGICAGIYTLIAEGAASIETITVGQPDILDVQTSITPIICYTDENVGEVNFTISGGTPFGDGLYDISWADGMTPVRTNVVSNLAPSIYTFVISDANGCEQTEEVEISYPAPMTITSPDIYPLNCFGINKGEISIWAEGNTPALEYRIEGPLDSEYEHTNNSGIFTNLAAGSYKVFITDGNGCTQTFPEDGEYEITQPDKMVITTVTSISARPCHDDTIGVDGDGIIEMKIEGGTGDYTYGWDNGQQTLNLEYPIPGLYVLTVTDENQCVALKNVEIPGPEPIIITFEYDTADCRVVDIGIGNVNGGINISAITGGNAESGSDYSLKWYRGTNDEHLTDFDNNLHLKGRQANEFYAVVTDLEGCIDTTDFAIPVDENNLFDVLITKDNNYCYRDQAYLTALVETPNLISVDSYRWVNVTDNPDIENKRVSNVYTTGELLHSTLFRVDAVSKKGCIESAEATLSVYPRIGPFIDRDTHPFFVASDLDAFKVETEDGESYSDSTIISLLADTQYPIEIFTENADYTLSYSWTPVTCFEPNNEKQTVMIFRTGEYQSLLTGAITNQTTHKVEQYIPIVAMVKSEYECIEEVNLKARILDKIKNSNVFSPNGDGINDLWKIPYSDVIPNLEIKIFNRWGANVWSAKGSEAIKGWDGKNSRGKDLSIGTYYYVISFNVVGTNKWKPISGSVTIIR